MSFFHARMRRLVAVAITMMLPIVSCMAQVSELLRAVQTNDVAGIEQLLASNPGLVNAMSPGGSTPLHIAAGMDNPDLVRLLLQHKADINARTKKGLTPLHVAAYVDAGRAAEALVSAGADVSAKASDGLSPMQLAADKDARTVIEVLTTRTKLAYTERFMDPRCAESQEARESGRLQRLREIYSALLSEQPDAEKINFAYGMVCMCLEDYPGAQLAFERIIREINPENDRARQELANAYLSNKQYDQAQQQYEEVLTRNPQASGRLRDNLERLLQLARLGGKKWYLSGRVDAGAFDDSNVNIGPNSRVIGIEPIVFGDQTFSTLTVDEGTLPMRAQGVFASAILSGAYDCGEQGGWMITADGAFYQSWLEASASSNRSSFYQAAIGLRDGAEQSVVKYPLKVAHIGRGGDALLDIYGFAPSYQSVTGSALDYLFATEGDFEMREWDSLTDRNGYYATIGERFQHVIGQKKHSIGGGLSVFDDHTKAGIYRNTGIAVNMDGYIRLPAGLTLYARARYAYAAYAAKEELAPETRRDSETDLTGGLNWMMSGWWGIDVNYAQTFNNSTFALYTYDRGVATLGTFCTF